MSEYERGFIAGRDRAAETAENFYPSIIRCEHTGDEQHVRLHVETKWCLAIAERIRSIPAPPKGEE